MKKNTTHIYRRYEGRFSAVFSLIGLWLSVDFLLRLALTGYSAKMVSFSFWVILKTFLAGFLFDIVVAVQGVMFLAVYLAVIPRKWFDTAPNRWLIRFFVWLGAALMLFGAVAEYYFWDEFQARFNFIAVDYLIYTNEVLRNIMQSYPVYPLLAAVFAGATGIACLISRFLLSWETSVGRQGRLAFVLLFVLFPFLAFWGVNSNYKNISNNMYNNELAGNGLYELFYAFRNNELDYNRFYLTVSEQEAAEALKNLLKTPDSRMLSNELWDVTRQVEGQAAGKKPNVVLIVVESLSSDFLGIYGNRDNLTPRLDALAQESLWFTRVYATGTRTVRGLEAITLAVPPTPGQSIVRRPDNQDLFTLGSVLNSHGYASYFLYGGYGYFDNMNEFFSGSNYQVVDRTDIPPQDIIMENAWGVADEVLFNQAVKKMDEDFRQGKKSFQMVLTTSNHRPFTYPDGRIDISSPGNRSGAVKYTDWAIGDFIEQAKKKPWFGETVFVIIADHQADSAGYTEVPIRRYHIPLLVYAPYLIKPGKVDRLMSQIDIAPTLLGLLDFSYQSRFLGYDILKTPAEKDRIFISTYQSVAYAKGNELVVLKPRRQVTSYQIDYNTGEYIPTPDNPVLVKEAVAWYQGASAIFKNEGYRAIR